MHQLATRSQLEADQQAGPGAPAVGRNGETRTNSFQISLRPPRLQGRNTCALLVTELRFQKLALMSFSIDANLHPSTKRGTGSLLRNARLLLALFRKLFAEAVSGANREVEGLALALASHSEVGPSVLGSQLCRAGNGSCVFRSFCWS